MKPLAMFTLGVAKVGPDKDVATIARASCENPALVLRANGAAVTGEARDEMLRRCAAGDYVELELDVLAFEQRPGVSNRNYVRFRDGGMLAMGRTGVGTPFLRDHDQWDAMARGGTVVASTAEKRGEGDYAIRQTVKLTAPWAVELALRGLLTTLSIGWRPTGPVLCTVCNANFFRCSHMPGQRYTERADESAPGGRTFVPDPTGTLVCECLYTAAELVETSGVNVPAVPSAQIEAIRASLAAASDPAGELAAAWQQFRALWAPDGDGLAAQEQHDMKFLQALAALLCLPPTASEDDVLRGAETMKRAGDTAKAELAIAQQDLKVANAENAILSGEKKKSAADKFIADALATGRITLGDEAAWREFYGLSKDKAEARMSERPAGAAMPVGVPRQSLSDATPPPVAPVAATLSTEATADLAKRGVDPAKVNEIAGAFGVTNPGPAIADGLKKGA